VLDWFLKGIRKTGAASLQAGLEHHQAGRLDQAEAVYKAVLAADPANADALHYSGVIAYQRGDMGAAASLITAALARNPANAPAHNNLGNALAAQGQLDRAIDSYREAARLAPGYVDALVNLGAKLKQRGDLAEAAAAYREALAHAPAHAMALSNLGAILNEQANPHEALALCEQAIAARPNLAEAHNNLGNALQSLGRREEAEAAFRQALALKPDMASASLNYGFSRLLAGDYEAGLPLLEKRFEASVSLPVHFGLRNLVSELDSSRRWTGQAAKGTLLIWSDQGLGDSLMTLRYLPLLKARGFSRVRVYGEPALARLFRATPGVDEFISKQQPLPAGAYDWHCPNMSLPLAFGTRVETIPREVPYIGVSQDLVSPWQGKLSALAGKRIGLAWAGTKMNPKDAVRSVPLAQFAPLFAVPGISFVSLQKGDGSEEIAGAPGKLHDWMGQCGDLLDTAALMTQLDLVITVDTAVVHLAGALGRPAWMLNRYESEWRWMLGREDSPWYPTLRLFRQERPGDWSAPIARLAGELSRAR
jgi:tetratricopeptide (TPR) repeat protein